MAASEEPSLVLFDLGGVVCRFLPERRVRRFASGSGLREEEVRRRLFESGFSRRCDLGQYGATEMYSEACRRLGWQPPYEVFRSAWASAFEADPAVLSLVARIRRTRPTGLLTDNAAVLQEALGEELREVGAAFDLLLFSWELRRRKPDPQLFQAALARAGRTPPQALFIDDAPANVAAAARLGIHALRFSDAATLERDLGDAGLPMSP